jgi:Family of unknown function (DUF6161)
MTLKELKENIAASPNKEWLQNYQFEINYPHINYKATLNGVVNVYEFITDQVEGYTKIAGLPDELNKIRGRFIRAKENLLHLMSQNDINRQTWDNNLRNISGRDNQPVFLYNSPEVTFLLKAYQENPEVFPGAYEYLIGSTSRVTQKNFLTGYILAYEFATKDFSMIAERKEAEKKTMQATRINFQEKLGEAEKEVIEYITKANKKFDEYAKNIDILKIEKEEIFNDWFKKTSEGFSNFNVDSAKKIQDFEELYREKLKLEAPAKYWSDRAKKLRSEGYWWLAGLIASLIVGIGILIWSLSEISNGTLEKIFQNSGTAIKWSVVFITLISFIAFSIRIFSKLTFSSFHLVRDAEEREQLTYVYLALQKDKGVDQTERHLIMQSLFSRADSGLLKDDSGPTMPGHIIDQVTKK